MAEVTACLMWLGEILPCYCWCPGWHDKERGGDHARGVAPPHWNIFAYTGSVEVHTIFMQSSLLAVCTTTVSVKGLLYSELLPRLQLWLPRIETSRLPLILLPLSPVLRYMGTASLALCLVF